jgi:serine/threonine protein kinase
MTATILPNYTIYESILRSPEIAIYRGRRDSDGAAVLIKVPEPGAGRDSTLATLRHEYRLLRELDIPGVPRALALEVYPGGRALIFADVPGKPLSDMLTKAQVELRTALGIGVALSRALEGLHHRGMIHKSLRPQHILCDPAEPSIHLVDFSLTSPLAQEPAHASPFIGELTAFAYISPEQTAA